MDVQRIRDLIARKYGVSCVVRDRDDLANFERFLQNVDINEYLTQCLPAEEFTASGVGIKSLRSLMAENLGDATPGAQIFPRGYLVIATSIGGNVVCVHESGKVYWADHSSFGDDYVSFEDAVKGEWVDLPLTDDNLVRAMVPLSSDFEAFLLGLLRDELTDRFEELDQ